MSEKIIADSTVINWDNYEIIRYLNSSNCKNVWKGIDNLIKKKSCN